MLSRFTFTSFYKMLAMFNSCLSFFPNMTEISTEKRRKITAWMDAFQSFVCSTSGKYAEHFNRDPPSRLSADHIYKKFFKTCARFPWEDCRCNCNNSQGNVLQGFVEHVDNFPKLCWQGWGTYEEDSVKKDISPSFVIMWYFQWSDDIFYCKHTHTHTHTHIYIYIYIYGNGHDDTSSNPGRDWSHFT